MITADDDADSIARAQAIALVCENDLSRLEKIFNTNFQTGDTHDHTVWVQVWAPGGGNGASNYGFESDQSSRININGTYNKPAQALPDPLAPPFVAPDLIKRDYACFLFIAELAEILMDFTGGAWDRGASSGEGLSIYLGTLLHPTGYYGAVVPRVNSWLNSDRPNQDWINQTEDSDTNPISNGCALLFIYFLVDQLGFPIEKVIGNFDNTMAGTFARLTGQPSGNAFTQLSALINRHYPLGSPKVTVGRDNIFPLREPAGRSVYTGQSQRLLTSQQAKDPEYFNVKPGLFCPEKNYAFYRLTEKDEYAVFAGSRGIFNAAFTWKVNGVVLPTRNKMDSVTVAVPRSIRTPDGKTLVTGKAIVLNYGIIDNWNKSELFIYPADSDSNCELNVTIEVTEAAVHDAAVSGAADVGVDPVSFTAGADFIKDRRRCNPFYATISDSLRDLSKALFDAKNRPDPPPDERLIAQILDIAARVQSDAQKAAKSAGVSQKEVLKELQHPGALFSSEAVVAKEVESFIAPNKGLKRSRQRE